MDGKSARAIVRRGYDLAAHGFLAMRVTEGADSDQLEILQHKLSPSSRVLDAGCGSGVPVAQRLQVAGHRVIGLDLSATQLQLSRQLDIGLQPIQADLAALPFHDRSFEAVVSYYAVFHVPRDEHRKVLDEFNRVLVPQGLLLVCMGWKDVPADLDPESWLGAPMFWSHYDAVTNLQLIEASGFAVTRSEEVPDPNGHGSHQFVHATRP